MRIDRLTPQQEQALAARTDRWVAQACSTEPLDRRAAEQAIGAVYKAIGEPRPQVLFFSSPLVCLLAWGALRACGAYDHALSHPLRGRILARIPDAAQAALVRPLSHMLSFRLAQRLRREIEQRLTGLFRGQLALRLEGRLLDLIARPGRASVLDPFLDELRLQLPPELLPGPWSVLRRRLLLELRRGIVEQIGLQVNGTWECAREVFAEGCMSVGTVLEQGPATLLATWLEQGRCCHWWLPYEGLVLASDRPRTVSLDERERLHDATRSALDYRDGHGIHAWHGVVVPPRIITDPGSVSILSIELESNAEVRRVMLERYGWSRYMAHCDADVVDSVPPDHPIAGLRGARLLHKHLPGEPEPLVYLEMVNSTPEPDGSHRRYLERIDPKVYNGAAGRLCQAAMASRWLYRDSAGRLQRTFARWQDYVPAVES